MLSLGLRKIFKTEIREQLAALDRYTPVDHLFFFEARKTLIDLLNLIDKNPHDLESKLQRLFIKRWQVIQYGDAHYLQDFKNPANLACISIAKSLGKILGIHFIKLLIPSLKEWPEDSYVISPFSDDMNLREYVLTDENRQLSHVCETVEFAIADASLKYSCIYPERGVVSLEASDKKRLLSRHDSVQQAYDAIVRFVRFKSSGDSVGSALQALIDGLNGGGVHEQGAEYIAGWAATKAIFEFGQYLETLSDDIREQLMKAGIVDRFTNQVIEEKTVRYNWELLTKKYADVIKDEKAEDQDIIYCVEMIATFMNNILVANPFLFELRSYDGYALEHYATLEKNVVSSIAEMKESVPKIKEHKTYGRKGYLEFCYQFLRGLQVELAQFPIQTKDLKFLIRLPELFGKYEFGRIRPIRVALLVQVRDLIQRSSEINLMDLEPCDRALFIKNTARGVAKSNRYAFMPSSPQLKHSAESEERNVRIRLEN